MRGCAVIKYQFTVSGDLQNIDTVIIRSATIIDRTKPPGQCARCRNRNTIFNIYKS